MAEYHHECRRPRGVYLSIDHADSIEEAFTNFGAGSGEIDLILATDAERILGIGDWGVGGIEVAIGKLAIYTAAGGIDPTRAIPVMLDVGTNCESLLGDPLYIGNRHARIRGQRYDDFIDAYVRVVTRMFPHALLQWEDFAPGNGRRILEKYRDRICIFNDDMQGTGAITLAAAISAVRVCGTSAAEPARGHLRSWHGGNWSRRPASGRHGARGHFHRGCRPVASGVWIGRGCLRPTCPANCARTRRPMPGRSPNQRLEA